MSKSLDIYLPLLSLSCLIFGRSEIFAKKNTFGRSFLDGLGMGLGFLMEILLIGAIREFAGNLDFNFKDLGMASSVIGNDGVFSLDLFNRNIEILSGIKFFLYPAGAFIILGLITALISGIKTSMKKDKI
jgi:electron transport complex protein RnfE